MRNTEFRVQMAQKVIFVRVMHKIIQTFHSQITKSLHTHTHTDPSTPQDTVTTAVTNTFTEQQSHSHTQAVFLKTRFAVTSPTCSVCPNTQTYAIYIYYKTA